MVPRSARLRRRAQFVATVRAGRRHGRGAVVAHFLESAPTQDGSAQDGSALVGFVVGRQVGPAVIRNLVRRRLRHLVRDRLAQLPPGSRLVIRARPGAAVRSYQELGRDLDAVLGRLTLRRLTRSGGGR